MNPQFHPSQLNLQQLIDAASTAAADATEAAKGLTAITAPITLAASTFESKIATVTADFDEQMNMATRNLTTQVQASDMRIQNATTAATTRLSSHVDRLNTALRVEYNHLFGQLSGHTFMAVDEKVGDTNATIQTMLDVAQAKTAPLSPRSLITSQSKLIPHWRWPSKVSRHLFQIR